MIAAQSAAVAMLCATSAARATPIRVIGDDAAVELTLAAGAPSTVPTTGVSARAEGAWIASRGVSGAAGGISVRGTWAPLRWLELGAETGVEGWSLGADGLGASRLGLSNLLVSVGTGLALGRAAEAVRLVAGVGPRAIGVEAADAADRAGLVALRVDGVFLGETNDLRLQLELGVALRDVVTVFGGGQIDVVMGRRSSVVRLVAGGSERAGGPSLACSAHAGVVVAVARTTRLRVTLSVPVLDTDPFGRLVWLSLGLVTVQAP